MLKKKLRYVPGLISLLGLPILFIIFPVEDPPPREVVLSFRLPATDTSAFGPYTDSWIDLQMKKKNITRIYLNDIDFAGHVISEQVYAAKFDLISREMQRLSFIGDSSIVLQVEMGSGTTYGDWVKLLNFAAIYQLRRYTFTGNSFYFLGNIPAQRPETKIYELKFEPMTIDGKEWKPPTKWEVFISELSLKWDGLIYLIKDNLRITIPFAVLIIVPWIIWLRKNLRRKLYVR